MRYSNTYGYFELNPMPGCNNLVVSNHAFIKTKFRGQGFGQQQHEWRLEVAKDLGYSAILCTCQESNDVQIHIMKKNGWVKGARFLNQSTGELVAIWLKNL